MSCGRTSIACKLLHQMTAGMRPPMPTRAEPSATGMATKRLGDYDIVREIGRGGMGIVYEARQLSLNRQVALKVLPFAAMLDEKQIARFRNEAQAAAQLHHPNIVPVYAVGQERGVHYFAMQYVPGQSLETAMHELRQEPRRTRQRRPSRPDGRRCDGKSPAPTFQRRHGRRVRRRDTATFAAFSTKASTRSRGYCRSVARLMIQAAEALQHAHEYGVIHRDVKPSNLLLDRDGKLWVTDFGLARMQTDSGVTITGDVVGTLRYMSPEQAAGATALVDARADVYSLGATLYELLTLRPAHTRRQPAGDAAADRNARADAAAGAQPGDAAGSGNDHAARDGQDPRRAVRVGPRVRRRPAAVPRRQAHGRPAADGARPRGEVGAAASAAPCRGRGGRAGGARWFRRPRR